MSEQETIADIIAEKRREANYIVQVAQGKCHTRRDKAEDEARDIRREADRLEAAHKRERGDCAKLREALKLCLRGMCGYCRMDAEARGMTTECVNGCEVMLGAKAALAATEKEGGNDANE